MNNAALLSLVVVSWSLFGIGEDPYDDVETIGEFDNQKVIIPEPSETAASREEALEMYREYLDSPETDPASRAEAQRRMGDLNVEAAENAQFENAGIETEAAFHSEAIVAYQGLLDQEDGYEKADLVLYQLARAYESVGQPEQALATLERLVAEYPNSQYIDEAQFRRGELLFVRRNYFDAGSAFQSVVDMGDDSAYYEQALYMLGWSQFKQAEYDPTINNFLNLLNLRLAEAEPRTALEITNPDPGQFNPDALAKSLTTEAVELQARFNAMSRPERELVDDTLRALSLTFSYMDGPETIGAVLDERANAEDPGYLLYTHLGDLYLSKERYIDAAESFDAFVAREPNDYSSPELSMRSIAAYKEGRFPSKVLEGKRAFVQAYGLETEYWQYYDPAERPDVIAPLKTNLDDLAQYDHAEAQRTGESEAYARAAEWYRRYLDYFPDDPDSAERSFLLGEVLMESDQFEEASIYYQRAAYYYPGYDDAALAGYAGLLASRAHHEVLQQKVAAAREVEAEASPTNSETARAATEVAELAADEWLQQQLYQAAKFTWSFPEHEEANAVLSDTAEQLYASQRRIAAIIVAGVLLKKEPPADAVLRRVAWTVAGNGHFELDHFPRAEQSYLALRDMGNAGRNSDPETMAGLSDFDIDERIAASIYRQAEVARDATELDAAVMHFLRVEKVTPTATIAAQATFDGAILLFNRELYLDSIDVMEGFRVTYPEHQYSNDITRNLAVAYQRTDQPLKAAVEYEAIVSFSIGEDQQQVRREAMYTAAELYQMGGDMPNARRVWGLYVAEYPKPISESIELRQVLADLALEAEDSADRVRWLESIIVADANAGAERSLRTKTLAGQATLELAEPKRLAFNRVKLTIPLDSSLQRKKGLMESALQMYNAAAGYGIAEITTEATYRIGEIYQQLSVDLMDSERPTGLGDDELEMYDILLEEQAFPFEEKAIEVYQANTGRALNGVWDQWVVKSYEQLANLMPARYAKYEKSDEQFIELY